MVETDFEQEDVTQEEAQGQLVEFDEFITGESSFLKSPAVGEAVEFTVKEIRKMPAKKVAIPGKKPFVVSLSSVDYYYDVITDRGLAFTVSKWQLVGKMKAIFKKLGKATGVQLKVFHVLDGRDTEKDSWEVSALVDGQYKQLNKESNQWQ